jgi:hypothetical protein
VKEAKYTLKLWYSNRKEVLAWQMKQRELARERCEVYTLLGWSRRFPNMALVTYGQRGHIERAAINARVQVIAVYHNPLLFTVSFLIGSFEHHRAVQQMLPCVRCLRYIGMFILRNLVGRYSCRYLM